jgi:hypothetical protein
MVPDTYHLKPETSQRGALFGLDARIAMAVFAVLTLVAGAAVLGNLDSSRAKSLAAEVADVGRAVEGIHADLKTDIFLALDEPSEKNAFVALYDNLVVTERNNLRGRWLGPYVNFTSAQHPRYGEMVIQKHPADHTLDCNPDELCYLWLVFSNVKLDILEEVNEIVDGRESGPTDRSGRLQWTPDRDNGILYFRVAKALAMDSF